MFHRLLLRFKLNSIGYGPKILGIIGLLMIGVPLALYGIYLTLGLLGIGAEVIFSLMKAFLWGGGVLLGVFVAALAIELAQDRYLDGYYQKHQGRKARLPDGRYECQYCGSQSVHEADRSCPACGTRFVQDNL